MANTLYDAARQAFLEAEIHWLNNTIKVYLVAGSNYTVNVASHATVDEIGSSGRVAGPVEIGSKSTTGGAADGADRQNLACIVSEYGVDARLEIERRLWKEERHKMP